MPETTEREWVCGDDGAYDSEPILVSEHDPRAAGSKAFIKSPNPGVEPRQVIIGRRSWFSALVPPNSLREGERVEWEVMFGERTKTIGTGTVIPPRESVEGMNLSIEVDEDSVRWGVTPRLPDCKVRIRSLPEA